MSELSIQIEIIKALGSILTAAIPSIVTFYLGRKFINTAKLKQKYQIALQDIVYLLSVEDLHCRESLENLNKSNRRTIRKSVMEERQLTWSGKNSLSRATRELAKQEASEKKVTV